MKNYYLLVAFVFTLATILVIYDHPWFALLLVLCVCSGNDD